MTAAIIFTSTGPVVIVTKYANLQDTRVINLLVQKDIAKFIGFALPIELVKERYGRLYDVVMGNIHETDELRVVDEYGDRIFGLFRFEELGPIVFYEGKAVSEKAGV